MYIYICICTFVFSIKKSYIGDQNSIVALAENGYYRIAEKSHWPERKRLFWSRPGSFPEFRSHSTGAQFRKIMYLFAIRTGGGGYSIRPKITVNPT